MLHEMEWGKCGIGIAFLRFRNVCEEDLDQIFEQLVDFILNK